MMMLRLFAIIIAGQRVACSLMVQSLRNSPKQPDGQYQLNNLIHPKIHSQCPQGDARIMGPA
jgi:hypothetical protein